MYMFTPDELREMSRDLNTQKKNRIFTPNWLNWIMILLTRSSDRQNMFFS